MSPKSSFVPPLSLRNDVVFTRADEAFAAKNLPDLGHDVKDLKVFSWMLKGWKKLDKKLTSEEFECGGHKWCVVCVNTIITTPLILFHLQENTTFSIWQLKCSSKRHSICIS